MLFRSPLAKTGFSLGGWNDKAAGTGISYATNASITLGTANVTLYAVWIPTSLTVSGSGNDIMITGNSSASAVLSVPEGVTKIGDNAF